MRVLNAAETYLFVATLEKIDRELQRCYWNKYQVEMSSPFSNTGNQYSCKVFSVHAYDWNNETNEENFVYPSDGVKAGWYKYLGRGDYIQVPDDWSINNLVEMLDDCVTAIREDFGEKNDTEFI